jgi:hypothetical protein
MFRELNSFIEAFNKQSKNPFYFYPDDVIVETDSKGKRIARPAMSVTFKSDKPCIFEPGELEALERAYTIVWERARERHRNEERKIFLNTNPTVAREQRAWNEYLELKGVKPGENPLSKGISCVSGDYVAWREKRIQEIAREEITNESK